RQRRRELFPASLRPPQRRRNDETACRASGSVL
ncbi:WD domain-containing protein, partial [Toxoplasma gondii ARI]